MLHKHKGRHVAYSRRGYVGYHIGLILIVLGVPLFSMGGEATSLIMIIVGIIILLDSLILLIISKMDPASRNASGRTSRVKMGTPTVLH